MYDKPIKMFLLDGILHDEKALGRMRGEAERYLEDDMRSKGYLPVIDLGSGYFTHYKEDGSFYFKVTMYGIYVGKVKANEWLGFNMGKLFQRLKSDQSLERSA